MTVFESIFSPFEWESSEIIMQSPFWEEKRFYQLKENSSPDRTLLETAIKRNLVIYDNEKDTSEITPKLIYLMKMCARRESYYVRITDLYFRESTGPSYCKCKDIEKSLIYGVRMNPVEDPLWNYIEGVFCGLDGYIPDKNLAVGLDLSRKDDFIYPYFKNLKKYICTDSTKVILGSY